MWKWFLSTFVSVDWWRYFHPHSFTTNQVFLKVHVLPVVTKETAVSLKRLRWNETRDVWRKQR